MACTGEGVKKWVVGGLVSLVTVILISMLPLAANAQAPSAGDPDIGRMLFTGEKSFKNGGPPCISCHSVGIGALGGGTLGPNLVKPNWAKYQSLAAMSPAQNPLLHPMWINNPSTPVMGPIFSKHPITQEEVNHLKAFLEVMAKQPPSSTHTASVVGIGAAGFVVILILFGIIWNDRYRNRVRGTAHEAIWRNYGGKGGI